MCCGAGGQACRKGGSLKYTVVAHRSVSPKISVVVNWGVVVGDRFFKFFYEGSKKNERSKIFK